MTASYLTIVSGLPRSGTSMMMQVLCAGGLEALVDHQRKADQDNPRGYFEFEAVKKTKQDPSWLMGSHGKVVKMVYRLLYDLPREYEYRVVFLRRDLKEVLASQNKMLQRLGKNPTPVPEDQMEDLFRKQLADFDRWIAGRRNFSILNVEYKKMVSDPRPQCEQINRFLDGRVNVETMVSVVDPNLYRNRNE
ncbi:MAG: sulfotransferase [Phycisphaerae bacterium]|nr:sulfotransferase [Phycisphaerae bacterium]